MRWYINRFAYIWMGVWTVGFAYSVTHGMTSTAIYSSLVFLVGFIAAVVTEDHK